MTERQAFEAWCDSAWGPSAYLHKSGCASDWDAWAAAIAHERARIIAALPPAGHVDAELVRRVVEG